MFSFGFKQTLRAKNSQVVALRAAAGENNLTWLGAKEIGRAIARVVERRPGALADVMHGRRVAPKLAEKWQHRLAHCRVEWCRGVVIEVNRPWHRPILRQFAAGRRVKKFASAAISSYKIGDAQQRVPAPCW